MHRGYILLARKIYDNDIMDKPPLYLKLWVWMLGEANFKDRDKLQKGQLLTSISDMQKAMSYKIGYRTACPSKDEIRSAYEAFMKATMITTTKTTRGMIITICNYNEYQNPKNYEAHNEAHNEALTKPTVTPHDTECIKERKKENKKYIAVSGDFEKVFSWFWEIYALSDGRGRGRTGDKIKTRKNIEKSLTCEDDLFLFCISVIEYFRQIDEINSGRTDDFKQSLKAPETFANNWRGYLPEDHTDKLLLHKLKKAAENEKTIQTIA